MRSNKFKKPRVIRTYSEDLCEEEPRKNLREVIDAMLGNEPTSRQLRKHTPLVPDGDSEDFDIGTREIIDLVDQQELEKEVAGFMEKVAKDKEKSGQEQQQKTFEDAVKAEVEKRMMSNFTQE